MRDIVDVIMLIEGGDESDATFDELVDDVVRVLGEQSWTSVRSTGALVLRWLYGDILDEICYRLDIAYNYFDEKHGMVFRRDDNTLKSDILEHFVRVNQ